MMRVFRWGLVVVAGLVVLAVAALAAVPYLVDTPRIQALIAAQATQALGRPVKFSAVSVRVLPLPAVVLKDLEVGEDPAFGKTPFLKLDQARVRLKLAPLLLARVELGDFVLAKPVISIVQAPDGRFNFATLGAHAAEPRSPARPRNGGGAAGAAAVLGSKVKIDDGVVTYESRAGATAARYRVEGLDLTLTGGTSGVAFEGDARVKPGDLKVKLIEGLIGLGSARTTTEAPLRGKVALDSKELGALAAVAMGPEPALGGGVKGTLALGGTVGKPRAAGNVELTDFAVTQTQPSCPEPKKRTLALGTVKLNVAWEQSRLTARPVTTALGGGSITTNATVVPDGRTRVELADLGIKGVPVEKVVVDYLCQGYAVTGPLDLTGAASARLGDLWNTLNGNGQLRLGPGKIVGSQALALLGGVVRVGGAVSSLLSADVPTSLFNSPLEYESVTATYTITNGVLSTRDLLYTSRTMKVAAAGTYALGSGAMNVDLTVNHGRGEIRAKVTGTAASPSIRVNPSTILRDVQPGQVEKGLQDLLKKFR